MPRPMTEVEKGLDTQLTDAFVAWKSSKRLGLHAKEEERWLKKLIVAALCYWLSREDIRPTVGWDIDSRIGYRMPYDYSDYDDTIYGIDANAEEE